MPFTIYINATLINISNFLVKPVALICHLCDCPYQIPNLTLRIIIMIQQSRFNVISQRLIKDIVLKLCQNLKILQQLDHFHKKNFPRLTILMESTYGNDHIFVSSIIFFSMLKKLNVALQRLVHTFYFSLTNFQTQFIKYQNVDCSQALTQYYFPYYILSLNLSMDKQQIQLQSTLRLINSEQFTTEMAITYLFQWRNNALLLSKLLERIVSFLKASSITILPTAIFIMSLQQNQIIQKFCEQLSKESLSCYLLLRWSYSTYLSNCDAKRNKLDNSIFYKKQLLENIDLSQLSIVLKKKELMLNYTIALNQYYERLFLIPEKLKKYDKNIRNQKLRARLEYLMTKFINEQNKKKGILLPIQDNSCVAVNVSYDYCMTYPTKERIPFKIVFETLSQSDLNNYQQGDSFCDQPKIKKQFVEKTSLILPQSYFGTQWKHQKQKISYKSQYSHMQSYDIKSFIIKSGDDLRQEHMAMQLISMIKQICQKQNVKIWLKPYAVIPFNKDSGLIEFVNDTRTVSYLKERSKATSLRQVYKHLFGDNLQMSISNFIQSLAGYSVVQYLFQIKDRHNNNILIDNFGHIIHIDFSFILSSSPGNFGFEKAPFKLTRDYLELMEGVNSDIFMHFKLLFFFALKYIRKYKRQIITRVQIMAHCKDMKCFERYSRQTFEKRFHQGTTDEQLMTIIEMIIKEAISSYTTGQYDIYQWFTNYIYS